MNYKQLLLWRTGGVPVLTELNHKLLKKRKGQMILKYNGVKSDTKKFRCIQFSITLTIDNLIMHSS